MFFGVLCVLLDVLGVFLAYLVFSQQISINENFGVVGVFCRIWCFLAYFAFCLAYLVFFGIFGALRACFLFGVDTWSFVWRT